MEVLAYIFAMVAKSTIISFPPFLESHSAPYVWLRVSHVCRFWRVTALSFASLWTTVDAAQPRLVGMALARSRTAPLKVILRDRVCDARVAATLESLQIRAQIAEHCGRIEELHVEPHFSYGLGLLKSFRRPAPMLRSLTIDNVDDSAARQLPQMFSGVTPKLERLSLGGFVFWPGNKFKNLTQVCLHDQPKSTRPGLRTFLDFLAASPSLQQLSLIDAGPTAYHTGSGTEIIGNSVSLDALRTLDIGNWPRAESIATFLSHLTLPSSTRINIWGAPIFPKHHRASLGTLLPEDISTIAPLHRVTTLCVMSHTLVRHQGQVRRMFRTNSRKGALQVVSVSDGTLHLLGLFDGATCYRHGEISGRIDLQHVERFTFAFAPNCTPELLECDWMDLFRNMPRLHTLTLSSDASAPILALFPISMWNDESDHESAPVLCPKLTTLTVINCDSDDFVTLEIISSIRTGHLRRLTIRACDVNALLPDSDDRKDGRSKKHSRRSGESSLMQTFTTEEMQELEPKSWPSDAYLWAESRRRSA